MALPVCCRLSKDSEKDATWGYFRVKLRLSTLLVGFIFHKALCVSINQSGSRKRWMYKSFAYESCIEVYIILVSFIVHMPGFHRVGDIFQAHLRVVWNSGVIPFVVFGELSLPLNVSIFLSERKQLSLLIALMCSYWCSSQGHQILLHMPRHFHCTNWNTWTLWRFW